MTVSETLIEQWNDEAIDSLCQRLRILAPQQNDPLAWPVAGLAECGAAGVFRWFVSDSHGGFGWDTEQQTRAYMKLAEADLTTTFVITQLIAAIKRIAGSDNDSARNRWLEPLLRGDQFATVGISHLTTSRRHLRTPVLSATQAETGLMLNGKAPWATGAKYANVLVLGATCQNGDEVLLAVPGDAKGITAGSGSPLMALSASATDSIELNNTLVDEAMMLAGPMPQVLKSGSGGGAGGVQTSALAIGLANAVHDYLKDQVRQRGYLSETSQQFENEIARTTELLIACVGGNEVCTTSELRHRANDLVIRITSAAMTVAKGAGFVAGHPVGRWCQEALFFLVWSCPQPVADAHLCDLATSSFE